MSPENIKEIVPPMYDVNAKWDACIDLTVRRFVYSSLSGAFCGLLFFRQSLFFYFDSSLFLLFLWIFLIIDQHESIYFHWIWNVLLILTATVRKKIKLNTRAATCSIRITDFFFSLLFLWMSCWLHLHFSICFNQTISYTDKWHILGNKLIAT